MQQPYGEAYAAWIEARREWNALVRHNDLDPCEHPPLPVPSSVFTARPPRPPQVERPGGPGPVSDVPSEPEPGTPRTWEHENGRTQATQAGDQLEAVLQADPNWRVVEAIERPT